MGGVAEVVPIVLAIDLGTSGPKVAFVTVRGRVLDVEFEPVDLLLFPGGGAEQDPRAWWDAIRKATVRLASRRACAPDEVAAVAVTAQWSGTVPVDEQGEPVMNAISWMDTRGRPYLAEVFRGFPSVSGYGVSRLLTWIRYTGGVPGAAAKDSFAHILWVMRERPDVLRRTFKFLEPKDWVNQRLTGRMCATFDSIGLHWVTDNRDIHRVDYHPRLLALSGLERDRLPDLVRATDVIGTLTPGAARDLGLPAGLPVVGGSPDLMSGAIGSGAVGDFQAHLYVGTSSWILCHLPWKKTDLAHNMASLPSGLPGRYLLCNEQETAGSCLSWLRDKLFFPGDALSSEPAPDGVYRVFDQLVDSVGPGSEKVLFLPWLYGERTPVEDSTLRGGFLNVSLRSDRAHLVRAVYEGVAMNARWLLESVESCVGRRIDSIHFIGGGAKSATWARIFADVMDRTLLPLEDPISGNLRGAAFQAGLALGALRVEEIATCTRFSATLRPDPAHRRIYDELYREFREAHRRNRRMFARLNAT